MKHESKIISVLMNSFGRRDYHQMSSCLTVDVIFDGEIVYIEGLDDFLIFQKNLDNSYIVSRFELLAKSEENIQIVDLVFELYLPNHQKSELPATVTLYFLGELICKIEVRFKDIAETTSIYNKMQNLK